MALAAVILTLLGGVASPLMYRGGLLLQSLGFVVVTRGGTRPSRLHALARALVAWSPAALFILLAGAQAPAPPPFSTGFSIFFVLRVQLLRWSWSLDPSVVGLGVFALGGLWAFWRPTRGLHDWLAGTRLVPP
jgi:hypothetical protein